MMPDSQSPVKPPQVKWYVITGAPCSGKTAVIERLAQRGYRVVPEVARAYIDDQLATGFSLQEIKSDPLEFERHILLEKVRIEARLPRNTMLFLDRAIPDSFAYFRLEGLDPGEVVEYSQVVRYSKVFLFERLEFEKDAVRAEDQTVAERLERFLIQGYRSLGYDLIQVPVMGIEQRTDFVLSHAISA